MQETRNNRDHATWCRSVAASFAAKGDAFLADFYAKSAAHWDETARRAERLARIEKMVRDAAANSGVTQ